MANSTVTGSFHIDNGREVDKSRAFSAAGLPNIIGLISEYSDAGVPYA
jgi:hypothetical protein